MSESPTPQSAAAPLDRRGLLWGFASYLLWGFFPLYWKMLSDRAAGEILAHRMVWSLVFYLLIFYFFSGLKLRTLLSQSRRDWLYSALACAVLTLNWGIYIYAVNTDRILEGSLAYFINPILNVAVGVLFFREPFPIVLKLSVASAAIGVAAKIYYAPGFPWIALGLSTLFCGYGVIKKLFRIPASTSSVLEGAVGLLPALAVIAYYQSQAPRDFTLVTWILLIGSGVVTGLPLFLFSYAAQRIPYSVLGMLQFIAPTLQALVAVYVYSEPFNREQTAAFGFIWLGVLFYMGYQLRRMRPAAR